MTDAECKVHRARMRYYESLPISEAQALIEQLPEKERFAFLFYYRISVSPLPPTRKRSDYTAEEREERRRTLDIIVGQNSKLSGTD